MTSKSVMTPCRSRRGRAADHPLRLLADREHLARRLVHGDHGRLEERDPVPAHEHDGVGRPQIDGDVVAPSAAEMSRKPHLFGVW